MYFAMQNIISYFHYKISLLSLRWSPNTQCFFRLHLYGDQNMNYTTFCLDDWQPAELDFHFYIDSLYIRQVTSLGFKLLMWNWVYRLFNYYVPLSL